MAGDRARVALVRDLHGQRRVAEEHIAALLELDPERLAEEQRLEPGAVDEQVSFDLPACSVSRLRISPSSAWFTRRTSASTCRTPSFSQQCLWKERRELAGIEVIRVVRHRVELRRGHGLGRKPVVADLPLRADRVAEAAIAAFGEPMRNQVELGEALRKHQRVIVRIVVRASSPAREARTLLERRVTLAEELRFRDTDARERGAQSRPGALAHADDRNVGRLHQRHTEARWHAAAMFAAAITPAVSQPAVPPPTITIRRTGRTMRPSLPAVACSQCVPAAVGKHVEQLVIVATVRALYLVRDVQRLEEHVQLPA